MVDPRHRIIESYHTTIEKSFQTNCSQIKLINFGTGSGKTYLLFQSIYEAIRTHSDTQIIGIYVAPLREHLHIPPSLIDLSIPAYKIHSHEMKTTDEHLNLYKKWIPLILKNKDFWNNSSKSHSYETVQEHQKNLSKVQNIIRRIEYLKSADFGDAGLSQAQITKAVYEFDNAIEKFLEFLIKSNWDESSWPSECLKLTEIFYPLYLLREQSGILMLTYKKFETSIPYFRFNGKKWVKKNLPLYQYVTQNFNTRFIIAFDEQEDGYQIILDSMIDIITPQKLAINNALSSINREFATLFSDHEGKYRKLLKFINENPDVVQKFEEHIEKNTSINPNLNKFIQLFQEIILEGNSTQFLRNMAVICTGLEQSLREITQIFKEYTEETPITFDLNMLSRVVSKFENNRALLIPYRTYEKFGDDLMNIFSFNNLYIYNIEPLKTLFLTRYASGHVAITEDETTDNTSVAELVYAILAVRLQIKVIQDMLNNVLEADDSQSRSLNIWAKQVSRVQKASAEELPPVKYNYLDRSYVYEGYKSLINISEISRYQNPQNNLISHELREISIGSTAILTSPEKRIISMANQGGNIIFLISATGGICDDLSTSFDMSYLEDNLRDSSSGISSFEMMTEKEIRLGEEIRHARNLKRNVSVSFFNEALSSSPNIKTQEVVARFEKTTLKSFVESVASDSVWFSLYKIQELKRFIRFLLYLFEDDSLQEMFVFTQTLKWIKQLIDYCSMVKHAHYQFEQSSQHPDIYYVHLKHPRYQSNIEVKLILFSAAFNSRYYDKSVEKNYLEELQEAEGQKIFFITAYISASKGLNPIIKTQEGQQKDFDALVLLMDCYYSLMKPSTRYVKDKGRHEAIYHFALMKNLVNLGESIIEIKEFNKYLKQPGALALRQQQHHILLGKLILQSIGRTERRDFPGQVVKIFINEETQENLMYFYTYLDAKAPDEIRKLSVNNYEVYVRIQEEAQKHIIVDYDEHVYRETEAYRDFQAFRHEMLEQINKFHCHNHTFAITIAWDALRDSLVFKDPKAYLEKLKNTGLFPDEFIESLFFCNYEPELTPYLDFVVDDYDKKIQIISDSLHGKKIYSYRERLYPEYIKVDPRNNHQSDNFDDENNFQIRPLSPSTDQIYRLYKKLMPQLAVFATYIPRYHFFYDVLYPSFAEHFVECWIKEIIFGNQTWKTIKSQHGFEKLVNFKTYHTLYEQFDLYYVKGDELFCIDVKAWSQASGNSLSKATLNKTQDKLHTIATAYPRFRVVKGLLLNLHTSQEKSHMYSSTLYSGSLIFFDRHHFPVESKILRDFLFSREI